MLKVLKQPLQFWANLPPQTKKTVYIVGGGAVALGIIALLVHTTSATASVSDIPPVVDRALAVETDPDVLREFAGKLRAAGYGALADKVAGRLDYLMRAVYTPEAAGDKGATSTWRQALK
jgi:hypothetical protein